jgi:hypothetical protein
MSSAPELLSSFCSLSGFNLRDSDDFSGITIGNSLWDLWHRLQNSKFCTHCSCICWRDVFQILYYYYSNQFLTYINTKDRINNLKTNF